MLAKIVEQHNSAVSALLEQENTINAMAQVLIDCIAQGGTIYLCGNGGSAADCQHIAAELVGRFKRERGGYAAVALTTDTSILTAVGNDYGFESVFSRQVDALACVGDVLLCFSTSGNSANVVNAAEIAGALSVTVLAFTGRNEGALGRVADHALCVDSTDTARIQECHILVGHILCQMIEEALQ
jgi:D-sedoheptulose 7-phosphate isomerase